MNQSMIFSVLSSVGLVFALFLLWVQSLNMKRDVESLENQIDSMRDDFNGYMERVSDSFRAVAEYLKAEFAVKPGMPKTDDRIILVKKSKRK